MTDVQKEKAIGAMQNHGGSFVQALAIAYLRADNHNRAIIENAFRHLFEEYLEFARRAADQAPSHGSPQIRTPAGKAGV